MLNPEVSLAMQRLPDWSGFGSALVHARLSGDTWAPFLPSHFGVLKALGIDPPERALFVGWQEIWSPKTLSEQGVEVFVCEAREDLRNAFDILTPNIPVCEAIEDCSSLSGSTSESSSGETAVFLGPTSAISEELETLLRKLVQYGSGSVRVIKGFGRSGVQDKDLKEMVTALGQLGLPETDRFLCFPSVEIPNLLIRRSFLENNEEAWRHVRYFIDEDGIPLNGARRASDNVWRSLTASRAGPWDQCDGFITFSVAATAGRQSQVELLASSIGTRNPFAWTHVLKYFGSHEICREPVLVGRDRPHDNGSDFRPALQHRFGREPYRQQLVLSDTWLYALRSSSSLEGFAFKLNEYLDFLREMVSRGDPIPLDLIPDNLAVGSDGKIVAFDQEWIVCGMPIGVETLFIRGLLYFFQRHDLDLQQIPSIRAISHSYIDLLDYLMKEVGMSCHDEIDALEGLERKVREQAQEFYAMVDLRSLLRRRWGDNTTSAVEVSICFEGGSGASRKNLVTQRLEIPTGFEEIQFCCETRFPTSGRRPTEVMFRYRKGLGALCIDRLEVKSPKCGTALRIESPVVAEFLQTSQDDTSRAYSFSLAGFDVPDGCQSVDIVAQLSWPNFALARHGGEALINSVWGKEMQLALAHSEIERLANSASSLAKKLEESEQLATLMKSSKAWRLAELIRRVAAPLMRSRISRPRIRRTAVEILSQPAQKPLEKYPAMLGGSFKIPAVPNSIANDVCMISVLMPVHNTPRPWLNDAVRSVQAQSYQHWELILIDDGSTLLETRECLDKVDDPRIKKIHLTSSVGISRATNFGIESARGEVVVLMDHDDMLSVNALKRVAPYFESDLADIVYTDESVFDNETKIDELGYFGVPHLKPDYAPDLLLSHNYITHLLAIRKTLLDSVGGLRSQFDGAQDFDLLLRLTERTNRVAHVSEPLYFWRQSPQSTSLDTGAKPEAHLRGKQALIEALERRAIKAEVLMANAPHFFRVRRQVIGTPQVDIVVPFRDQPRFLQQCLAALLERTRYGNFRVICVDNGSQEVLTREIRTRFENETDQVRFIDFDGEFNFSRINNFAVQHSDAEHVVLMNNDVEVINADWLEAMLEHSQRPEVGAVGAKLFYPNDAIQHAGIAIGIGGYAGHPHKHEQGGFQGYLNRLNVIQNVSAVTAAMLMCKRATYLEVNGLDDEAFGIACNDVDFCLRLVSRGYRNIFTPYALAYHHESVSRGYEDTPEKQLRFEGERRRFQERHAEILATGDPYYNPLFRRDTEVVIAGPLNTSSNPYENP